MSNLSSADSGSRVCNLDYLLGNLGRNREAANRLVQLFLDSHPGLMDRLLCAAGDGDISALRNVVHEIRGSCVLFSAHEAVALARELEYLLHAHRDNGTDIDWLASSQPLRESLKAVYAELQRYKDSPPPQDVN